MRDLKILVIDSDPIRGPEICSLIKPFNVLSEDQACINNKFWRLVSYLDELTKKVNLYLLHLSDQTKGEKTCPDFLERLSHLPNQPLVVLYSAGVINAEVCKQTRLHLELQGEEKEWEFDVKDFSQFCVVKHSVISSDDLNLEEALKHLLGGGTRQEFCEILCPSREVMEVLSALCILCQGYLAIHAKKVNGKWGPEDIKFALERMNWPAFAESDTGKAFMSNTAWKQKQTEVSSPEWWSSIFDSDKPQLEKIIARECKVDDFAQCPTTIKKLVVAMYGGDKIGRHVVAEAYTAIVEQLGG